MKNEGAMELYIPRLCLNNLCNRQSYSALESRLYGQKPSKEMTRRIKVNSRRRVYVHKAKQRESTASELPDTIKYYPSYYVSPVLYGNP